jgi:hypothetical protein
VRANTSFNSCRVIGHLPVSWATGVKVKKGELWAPASASM